MTPLATNALKIAQSQIGVQEIPKGSNAGTDVEKYLKSVGLSKGYSWCMAFVYWCAMEASIQTQTKNKLKKTAGVLAQWNGRPELQVSIPAPGDLFIIDAGKGLGHTGFVEKLLPKGKMQTIEGNTNTDGSREGFKVCRRTRMLYECKGFLRI
jgi:CHAP domain